MQLDCECQKCSFLHIFIRLQLNSRKGTEMESTNKSTHTKQCQFEAMINFMTLHPDMSKGYLKTPEAKAKSQSLWKRLENDLNILGPPIRDVPGWKKVWCDHKNNLKAKLRKNKQNFSGTGGGPPRLCIISPLEERAIELLNMREAVEGLQVKKFGAKNPTTADHPTEPSNVEDELLVEAFNGSIPDQNISPTTPPQCSSALRSSTPCPPTRNPRVVSERQLLNIQVDNQIDYQQNSIKVLRKINDNLKSLVSQSRKKLQLKEKKYDLAKQKFEHKLKMDIENQQLKRSKLELKRQMFELQSSLN